MKPNDAKLHQATDDNEFLLKASELSLNLIWINSKPVLEAVSSLGGDNNLIQSDPSIMMGKPVIAGRRITVELIFEKLAASESVEQVLAAHPRLTIEAILAALDFARRRSPSARTPQ